MTTKKIARRREWRSKRRMDILLSCLHLSPIHPQYPFLRRKHRYIVGNISEYERDIVYSPFKRRLSISTFGFFQEENCFAMNVARGSLRMNTLSLTGLFLFRPIRKKRLSPFLQRQFQTLIVSIFERFLPCRSAKI